MLHQYLLDLSILPKEKKIEREGDITGLLEVNFQGGCLIERDASREAFCFARGVIGSTRRRTIFKKLLMIFLQRVMTPLLVSLEMFDV